MITSILFKKVVNVGVNSKREIFVNIGEKEVKLNLDTDIPVIRYKFDGEIGNDEVTFIKNNMLVFNRTVPILELKYDAIGVELLRQIREANMQIGVILHVDIFENEVLNKALNPEHKAFTNIAGLNVDRVVFNDVSDKMDTIAFNTLVKEFADAHGMNKKDIGICGSPLSFGENCCLSSIKAREIMAKYSTIMDLPLPSGNHQDMNTCGCMRYVVINDNLPIKETATKAPRTAGAKKSENKDDTVKVKKSAPSGFTTYNNFRL